MTVELLSGRSYPDARLIDFSFEALRIKAGSEFDVSWSLIAPNTARKVANIVYPEEPFERGRFLTSQKLWNEAKDAFEEAVRQDEDFEYQVEEIVPILDKLIAGEGAFHGSAVRVGRTGLELTYDFSSEGQGQDFHDPGPAVPPCLLSGIPPRLYEECRKQRGGGGRSQTSIYLFR